MSSVVAIIVAAGKGERLAGVLPKQYLSLKGKAVLCLSIQAFLDHPKVSAVQVVIGESDLKLYDRAVEGLDPLGKLRPPVIGGANRTDSVINGLKAIESLNPDKVLIHDGARPNISKDVISRVIETLEDLPGCIPAMPATDTLKRVSANHIRTTVPRDDLWRAQTPQGFWYGLLVEAYGQVDGQSLTDDASVFEALGHPVKVCLGDENNIKVTYPGDIEKLEILMSGEGKKMLPDIRLGNGYDVHAIGPGSGVIINGVSIPCDFALVGHSDADVGLHAITDAILGAIAEGDIGTHFSPSDPRWKGGDSRQFLKFAVERARDKGFEISNVDVTIICERPKVGPHREAMRQAIAVTMGVSIDRVSVKATTTEKLGFTGRGEGIAAQATVLVVGK